MLGLCATNLLRMLADEKLYFGENGGLLLDRRRERLWHFLVLNESIEGIGLCRLTNLP